MSRPRALLFTQYLHALGGGERVMTHIAQLLSSDYRVVLGAPRLPSAERWQALGFPDGVDMVQMDARRFVVRSARADLTVVMSNHVPLPSLARRNVIVVQFPNDRLPLAGWRRRMARRTLDTASLVTYSEFNAGHIADRWEGRRATVVAPPVQPRTVGEKERLILSVGRLTDSGNHKRHDTLIEAFERLRPAAPGWRLVIAGGGRPDDAWVRYLTSLADRVGSVEVRPDLPATELSDLYANASIYWHGAGYGRLADDPAAAEHFGMSTVEAMSAGAVPLVFNDGGQPEIVADAGLTWNEPGDLVARTLSLIEDPIQLARRAEQVRVRATSYGSEQFAESFLAVLESTPHGASPR